MAMADIQVQPSVRGEGLPRTIIEAMANGTASVVTTTGGAPELVDDGKTGFIVPTADAQALGEAMNKIAHDKQQCSDMGLAAKERLARHFSSKVTVAEHLKYFERLLGHSN
jgi:glycosyltransferase involved in cell wall biosynthesis